jgi:adenosylcobinamide-phosphate synthase
VSALAVVLALALDLAAGDPPNRYHPVAWIGRMLARGRAALARGGPVRLVVAGGLLVLGTAAVAAVAAAVVETVAAALGPAGVVLQALALKSLFALRGLLDAAANVARQLTAADLVAARASVGRDLVSRGTRALDESQVASAAIESVAENLTDSLLAPVVCFLVFGLPGAAVYRVVNTADAMIGYRDGVLEHFGKVAARLDDLLNLLPARVAALALVVAAALAGADGPAALRVLRRDRGRTASPNAGWTMAAMAGALGVTLEKPGVYRLGDGRPPEARDVGRGLAVASTAAAVGLVAVLAASLLLSFMAASYAL